MIGKTLGSYQIQSHLGEGGMGVVYRAVHPLMGRSAAIKLLLPRFSAKREIVERFFNEARAAASIKHGGIIDILDFGYADDGSAYITMELLEGESLTSRVARGPMQSIDVLRIGRQMASALDAAHQAGIVHRDFKPDNVFIVPDSEVVGGERTKILDFGIAKLTSEDPSLSKTRTGVMMGSPLYMSPEQCRGGSSQVDARADVYALGCVLFHMLTGRPPFDGVGVGDVLGKHQYEKPQAPSVARAGLSDALDALVLRCLAKKPEGRFASMQEVIAEIDALSPAVSQQDALVSAKSMPLKTPAPNVAAAAMLTQTTLGNTAREVDLDYDPSKRSPMQIATPLLLIAVLGVGGYLLFTSESKAPLAASAIDGAPALRAATPARGDAAPATEVKGIDLALVTTPPGAQIYRQGSDKALGHTPFHGRLDVDAFPAMLIVRMQGYADREVEISGPRDAYQSLRLRKMGAAKNTAKRIEKPAAAAHDARTRTPARVPKPDPPARVLDDDDALNPFGP